MKKIPIIAQLNKFKTNYEKLQYLIDTQKSNYLMYLTREKFGLTFLFNYILKQTPLLDDSIYELKTKIYWVLNNITDFPKCEICEKKIFNVNVYSVQQGYKKLLCANQQCNNKRAYNLRKKTMSKNYGVENNFARKDIIEKIEKTNIEKYGNTRATGNEKIREKIKRNNLTKYGHEYYSSTSECREKVRNTVKNRYNVNHIMQLDYVKEKAKKTSLKKYGTEHPMQSKKFKEEMKQNLIAKYGENYTQILMGNKGNPGQSKRAYRNYILKSKFVKPIFTEDYYIEQRKLGNNNFLFECKKCKKQFQSYWDNGSTKTCPYCKITEIKSSKTEYEVYIEILNYVNNKYIVKHGDRSILGDLELDIYIPDKKLAIEFNGLYWHNDDNQQNYKYHLNKTELCEKQGIQLIHIFENEWNYSADIVKSRLKNLLGIHDKIIYARKCEVKEIKPKESIKFQDENHIQGAIGASVHLGLFYKDELISIMTFGKTRFNKKYEYEMLRFCNKLNHHIPGAAGKLLKYFERNYKPKSIVSYADRRWSQGNLYKALGFELSHTSHPNYWYFKSYTQKYLESRIKYQKHKLEKLLEKFDPNKTEVENMKDNGYYRIFDCGNLVFTKFF